MLKKTAPIDVGHKKLNIIPILDAVFIFIFFLLFSTQFVKIYVIGTDVPIVSEIPNDEIIESEPLNLRIKVNKSSIIMTKGIDNIIFKTLERSDDNVLLSLKNEVFNLKKEYPKENVVIISPDQNIKYDFVIKTIDAVRDLPDGLKFLKLEKEGKEYKVSTLFGQIVMEPTK